MTDEAPRFHRADGQCCRDNPGHAVEQERQWREEQIQRLRALGTVSAQEGGTERLTKDASAQYGAMQGPTPESVEWRTLSEDSHDEG